MLGHLGNAALWMLCLPLYLHLLGGEAYGLVGFFLMVQVLLAPLDLGLSLALNRELALLMADPGTTSSARSLCRRIEIFYLILGAAIGLAVAGAAPLLAAYWFNTSALSEVELSR